MKTKMMLLIFSVILFSDCQFLSGSSPTNTPAAELPSIPAGSEGLSSRVTVPLTGYSAAFANPYKGFRVDVSSNHEFATLYRHYIKWNQIENSATDGVDKIKGFCNTAWAGLPERNIKVIPRVYLQWPNVGTYWPADLTTGDFTSEIFRARVIELIAKLGAAWDQDDRVAYIEMGIIGLWGEQHSPSPDESMQKLLGDAFVKYFPHKKVQVRYPWNFTNYSFGYYWDSFAHADDRVSHVPAFLALGDRWKTQIFGGETAYDWGHSNIQPGDNPDDTLSDSTHRNFLLDEIRRLHANELGWVASYTASNAIVEAGAQQIQKALGYRFVITESTYESLVNPGSALHVSFSVHNEGSAPFYYNWKVGAVLLDAATRKAVCSPAFSNSSLTTWLPGDKWNDIKQLWDVPAQTYSVDIALQIPADVPRGRYILALFIPDPAGGAPSLRFANNEYWSGGWTVLGWMGLGTTLEGAKALVYDDLAKDKSLSYKP